MICNVSADRYLDADRNNNFNVDTSSAPTVDDIWTLIPEVSAELGRLRNVHFDRYLQEESDRNVRTSSTHHRDDTRWEVIDNGDGTVLLRNVASGRYLDYDRTNVDTSSSPSADDVWELIPRGEITLIRNVSSDRYLDADRDNNYNVDTSPSPSADDEWDLIPSP